MKKIEKKKTFFYEEMTSIFSKTSRIKGVNFFLTYLYPKESMNQFLAITTQNFRRLCKLAFDYLLNVINNNKIIRRVTSQSYQSDCMHKFD